MLSTPSGFIVTQSNFDLKSKTPHHGHKISWRCFSERYYCADGLAQWITYEKNPPMWSLKTISRDCYGFQNILIFMFGWKCPIVFLIYLHNSNIIVSGNNYALATILILWCRTDLRTNWIALYTRYARISHIYPFVNQFLDISSSSNLFFSFGRRHNPKPMPIYLPTCIFFSRVPVVPTYHLLYKSRWCARVRIRTLNIWIASPKNHWELCWRNTVHGRCIKHIIARLPRVCRF